MGAAEAPRLDGDAGRQPRVRGARSSGRSRSRAPVGRALTAPHHGRIRSGFAGQGNAILFPKEAQVREYKTITLNTNVFCEERGARFGLTPKEMVWWERERRVCQVLQYELADRTRMLVANLHATHHPKDLRLARRRAPPCGQLRDQVLRARGVPDRRRRLQHHHRPLRAHPGADHRPPRIPLEPPRRPGSTISCCAGRPRPRYGSGRTRNAPTRSGSSRITPRSRLSWSCGRRIDGDSANPSSGMTKQPVTADQAAKIVFHTAVSSG